MVYAEYTSTPATLETGIQSEASNLAVPRKQGSAALLLTLHRKQASHRGFSTRDNPR